ncbi:MAG: hypothetical protein JXA42_21235, partial [Anaerolineales bacterium]|nr:hypothetical protein [Anaerolineales bacterium]
IRDGRTSSETIRRVADVEAALAQGIPEIKEMPVFEEYVVVDEAGRLQIPPELRNEMAIGSRVTLEKTDQGLVIRPVEGVKPIVTPDGSKAESLDDEESSVRPRGPRRWLKKKARTE